MHDKTPLERRNLALKQYSNELANSNTEEQTKDINNKFAYLREELLIERIEQLEKENKQLKYANRFWVEFFSESIRLFGEKQGKLSNLLRKSMVHIRGSCEAIAYHETYSDTESKEKEAPTTSNFDYKKFHDYCDEHIKKNFSKSHNNGQLILEYLIYTGSQGIERTEAIRKLTKRYHFPTPEACLKALERANKDLADGRIENLPNTWPKP